MRHDRRGRGIITHLLVLPGVLLPHRCFLIIPLAVSCAGATQQHLYHVTSVASLLLAFGSPMGTHPDICTHMCAHPNQWGTRAMGWVLLAPSLV